MKLFSESCADALQFGPESTADDVVSSAPFALEYGAYVTRGAVQESLFMPEAPQMYQSDK